MQKNKAEMLQMENENRIPSNLHPRFKTEIKTQRERYLLLLLPNGANLLCEMELMPLYRLYKVKMKMKLKQITIKILISLILVPLRDDNGLSLLWI